MKVVALGRWAVAFELDLYQSLARRVTRRPDLPVGAVAVPLSAFIIVSAIEVAVDLLLPWETVRIIADILGDLGTGLDARRDGELQGLPAFSPAASASGSGTTPAPTSRCR